LSACSIRDALDRWFEATAPTQRMSHIPCRRWSGCRKSCVALARGWMPPTTTPTSSVWIVLGLLGLSQVARSGGGDLAGRGAAYRVRGPDVYRGAEQRTARATCRAIDRDTSAENERPPAPRLEPLRTTAAGALPRNTWMVFDPQAGLAADVFPCTDGQVWERSRHHGDRRPHPPAGASRPPFGSSNAS
jgi:hypothetical protein